MQIDILMTDGRKVQVVLPKCATISSDQLRVLTQWAIEGRPAPELMVD